MDINKRQLLLLSIIVMSSCLGQQHLFGPAIAGAPPAPEPVFAERDVNNAFAQHRLLTIITARDHWNNEVQQVDQLLQNNLDLVLSRDGRGWPMILVIADCYRSNQGVDNFEHWPRRRWGPIRIVHGVVNQGVLLDIFRTFLQRAQGNQAFENDHLPWLENFLRRHHEECEPLIQAYHQRYPGRIIINAAVPAPRFNQPAPVNQPQPAAPPQRAEAENNQEAEEQPEPVDPQQIIRERSPIIVSVVNLLNNMNNDQDMDTFFDEIRENPWLVNGRIDPTLPIRHGSLLCSAALKAMFFQTVEERARYKKVFAFLLAHGADPQNPENGDGHTSVNQFIQHDPALRAVAHMDRNQLVALYEHRDEPVDQPGIQPQQVPLWPQRSFFQSWKGKALLGVGILVFVGWLLLRKGSSPEDVTDEMLDQLSH